MDRKATAIIVLGLFLLSCVPASTGVGGDICGYRAAGTVDIFRGEKLMGAFSVALADTPQSRRLGLMRCPALDPGTGMLFVYPDAGQRVFWMKNTPLELAVIFISADGRIAAIERGEPESLEHIRASVPVHSVLEIDYRESRHLAVGDRVRVRMAP